MASDNKNDIGRDNDSLPDSEFDNISATHYSINITINPLEHQLIGEATISINSTTNVNNIPFLLFPELNVTQVIQNNNNLNWNRTSTGFDLLLNQNLLLINMSLKIYYSGLIGYDYAEEYNYIGIEGVYLRNYLNQPNPVMGSWYPFCGYAPMDLSANVPKDLLLVAQGSLTGTEYNNNMTTFFWTTNPQESPDDLIIINSFKEKDFDCNGYNISVYYLSRNSTNIQRIIKGISDVISYYSTIFPRLPFSYLKIVETGENSASGESLQSIITIQNFSEPDEFDLEDTIAHEIAHQWWGVNAVQFDKSNKNHLGTIWIVEGMASYSAYLYESTLKNDSRMLKVALENCDGVAHHDFGNDVALNNVSLITHFKDPRLHSILIDEKAMLIFHMLRYVLGNSTFFSSIYGFFTEYENKSCTLNNFIDFFNNASANNLTWFFNEWLFETEYLDYYVKDVDSEKQNNHYLNTIYFGNDGKGNMPVDIEIQTNSGELIKLDKVWLNQTYMIKINTSSQISSVKLDPSNWLLDINQKNNNWTYSEKQFNWPLLVGISIIILLLSITVYITYKRIRRR